MSEIATRASIRSKTGIYVNESGDTNDVRCPRYSTLDYTPNLNVSGSFLDNQLVPLDNISNPLINPSFQTFTPNPQRECLAAEMRNGRIVLADHNFAGIRVFNTTTNTFSYHTNIIANARSFGSSISGNLMYTMGNNVGRMQIINTDNITVTELTPASCYTECGECVGRTYWVYVDGAGSRPFNMDTNSFGTTVNSTQFNCNTSAVLGNNVYIGGSSTAVVRMHNTTNNTFTGINVPSVSMCQAVIADPVRNAVYVVCRISSIAPSGFRLVRISGTTVTHNIALSGSGNYISTGVVENDRLWFFDMQNGTSYGTLGWVINLNTFSQERHITGLTGRGRRAKWFLNGLIYMHDRHTGIIEVINPATY